MKEILSKIKDKERDYLPSVTEKYCMDSFYLTRFMDLDNLERFLAKSSMVYGKILFWKEHLPNDPNITYNKFNLKSSYKVIMNHSPFLAFL